MSLSHQDINEANRRLTLSIFGRDPDEGKLPPKYPVIGLRVVPWGKNYLFDDFRLTDYAKKFMSIGAAEECDIHIDDPSVSTEHCLIIRSHSTSRVHVYDASKNGILVNGIRVQWSELTEGSLLNVGALSLIAFTERTQNQGYIIAASTIVDFVHQAVQMYGSINAAAEGVGVPRSTLADWLQGKFAKPKRRSAKAP